MTTPSELLTSGTFFQLFQLLRLEPDTKALVDALIRDGDADSAAAAFDQEVVAAVQPHLAALTAALNDPALSAERRLVEVALFARRLALLLKAFASDRFILPASPDEGVVTGSASMDEHIERMWRQLERTPQRIAHEAQRGTLIAPPEAYIAPGGRFWELFYWDSFFTAVGLAASGRAAMVAHIAHNFVHLIETLGYIPNGARTYFLGRSQTPYTVFMFDLLRAAAPQLWGDVVLRRRYVAALEKEYRFWMDQDGTHTGRAVSVGGVMLNRHWSNVATPRPEGYNEDISAAFAKGLDDIDPETSAEAAQLYRDLRAACESGWDFSTRWLVRDFAGGYSLHSIRTTQILPIDLNCQLYSYERRLADTTGKLAYRDAAERRKAAILANFWDEDLGWFTDRLIPADGRTGDLEPTGVLSIAGVYPLFCELLTWKDDAHLIERLARTLETRFLFPGGVVTTLIRRADGEGFGEQWDYPNGWAPHQWAAVAGLAQYGYSDLAAKIAIRFVDLARQVYDRTGKMMEKYNVADLSRLAGGGEYKSQEGFGWTNGVVVACQRYLREGKTFWLPAGA
ncbi:MAG: alpha,alpha-trehalase [Anaerolineae bacterium]|nr:alpha,alpha-trehalase [Anaerolineae bacterium]NUQ05986.1 hypothetical protein [Anaerolineae bacterium]